ncbi:MAG: aldose 1-epimerase family protein [Actinomycetota bacterium]|nr:aldose 1-epimerase family protein [Actinomycetota bacterium]
MEINGGGARAVVTELGATLRAFEIDGVAHLETFGADEPPPLGAGGVLVPWPNRVAGAEWNYRGTPQHLEVTEPARGNASHGLVRKVPWIVTAHEIDSVSLDVVVDGQPGWPFRFRASITYAVGEFGLKVTHGVHNLGDQPMPFGVGTHPYPRPGRSTPDDAVLRLAATTHLPLDPERMVPTGPAAPATIDGPVRDLDLDDAFGGCVPGDDGLVHHTLRGPDGGVDLWADPVFKWVQVFTPGDFPGRPGRAIAIEPMTCPPDALNSGVDLLEVAPGERWAASWGLAGISSSP